MKKPRNMWNQLNNMQTKHPSHETRYSDSSLYDEICENCGHTDLVPGGWGKLAEPCPNTKPGNWKIKYA